jgi:predicted acyltransferase
MSDEIIEQQPVVIESPVHGGTEEERKALEVRIITRDMVTAVPAVERNPDPPDLSANTPKRAFALDALRGLFLISMTFGFTIASQDLPAWMYHRQLGPTDTPVNIAGISWRDLAYASFLFTMAAALPLTLSRKIAKGEPELAIIFAAVKRWAMLLVYGLLVAHGNTYFIGYTNTGRVLALIAFTIMGMIFTRPRKDWNQERWDQIKKGGWLLAAAFLFLSPLAYGKTFTFTRIDDIMVDLAFASGVGMVLWYFTRNNIPVRVAALAAAVGLYIVAKFSGGFQDWWYSSPAPWAFQPSRLSLLTVVVPGTIAGDMILRWMNTPSADEQQRSWSAGRLGLITALCCAITPLVTVALYNRWVTFAQVASAALVVAGFFLTRNPSTPTEQMVRRLYLWASLWLLLGLAIEPTEGGIKKEPETLTYFFTVTGTTSMLLVAMTAITDALKKARWVNLLIDIGHNPLLCYVTFTVLINSALELSPWMRDFMTATPAQSLTRSVASLVITIAIVRYVSRQRIYWRT